MDDLTVVAIKLKTKPKRIVAVGTSLSLPCEGEEKKVKIRETNAFGFRQVILDGRGENGKRITFTLEDESEIEVEIEEITDEIIQSKNKGVTGTYSCCFRGKTEEGEVMGCLEQKKENNTLTGYYHDLPRMVQK